MNIAELFARIGLKTDEDKAKSFTQAMNGARSMLKLAAGAAGTFSAAVVKITKDAMDSAAALKQFEAETGASAQELQKWQAVAVQANQSAESVSSAIRAITSNQEAIKLGQGNISGYQLLGIDPNQDPFEILDQLRDKTANLDEAMKKNILSQMGVGSGMLQVLEMSRDEFDSMASRAFIISPSAINTLARTRGMMQQAGQAIRYLKSQVAVGLAPQIEDLTKKFMNFIKQNESGFIKGFQTGTRIIRMFISAISNAVHMVDAAVRGTIGWNSALKILLATIIAMNASLLLSPIGLITAGIILLIAVLDDLYVYSKGGDSLFGEMLKGLEGLDGPLGDLFRNLMEFVRVLQGLWAGDYTGGIQELIDQWGIWGDILVGIVESIKFLTGNMDEATKNLITQGGTTETGQTVTGLSRKTGGAGMPVGDWALWDLFKRNPGAAAAGGGGSWSTENNINITVDGSGSPEETGRAVRTELDRWLRSADSQVGRDE